jgi:N-acetyl-gamma-glutamyl-phosphate reductase
LLKAGVVGASGYTGGELLRILWHHPDIDVVLATANQYADEPIGSLYPSLAQAYSGSFEAFNHEAACEKCDVFFLGLPHGESLKTLPMLAGEGKRVVDLSADFRFGDAVEYEKWYGAKHSEPQLLEEAVYGIPEINREMIAGARITANPGCYPTAALIGIYPVAKAGLIGGTVVVDAKSGVSGAGRKPTLGTHYPQIADGIEPYSVSGHRHFPEMLGELNKLNAGKAVNMVFTPHLVPINRGILCTIYVPLREAQEDTVIRRIYEESYAGEPFVHLLGRGRYPQTKSVQGSNNCHVAVELPGEGNMLVVMTAIDNLVKGASGQAVQNMNLMCGLPETTGLAGPGLFP